MTISPACPELMPAEALIQMLSNCLSSNNAAALARTKRRRAAIGREQPDTIIWEIGQKTIPIFNKVIVDQSREGFVGCCRPILTDGSSSHFSEPEWES
ncbi:uncharacterized protein CTHT_0038280 [Thermochaetoides thermophila DSM 1495]|uniref:Uncharacterized protein n=1 Tax=Chaetomium thermophilum (strain DSM 1495 / CBS 144.50 / IMI 039719) TaxID=759272 RepID=G0S8J2_CHATD|nr:hypothetical protein CTHT_0038280 [Thermochaetoides thermophila DSM 1495]EGS21952.1 hypothetical protein CTHT_0038280 [Thermochaetoides thermophila DSM 1495]